MDYQNIPDIPDQWVKGVWVGPCVIANVTGGFRLYCDYIFGQWSSTNQVCGTYYYRDSLYFYSDGTFRPNFVIWGPGFADTKYYDVLYRIDHDIGFSSPNYFARWEGSWVVKATEGNYFDDFANRDGFQAGYEWRIRDIPDRPLLLHRSEPR